MNEPTSSYLMQAKRSLGGAMRDTGKGLPALYWTNTFINRHGMLVSEIVHVTLEEAAAEITDYPEGWHYLHTIECERKVSGEYVAFVLSLEDTARELAEEELQDQRDQERHDRSLLGAQ